MYCCGLVIDVCEFDLLNFISKIFPSRIRYGNMLKGFLQLAEALKYLHFEKNLAHLDFKLNNILI